MGKLARASGIAQQLEAERWSQTWPRPWQIEILRFNVDKQQKEKEGAKQEDQE